MHQLSRQLTQNPFRKVKGRLVAVEFHPAKPFFFVATYNNVRVYNLAKQALAKKLQTGSGVVSSLAVHPSGDHIIVGTEVNRHVVPGCRSQGCWHAALSLRPSPAFWCKAVWLQGSGVSLP